MKAIMAVALFGCMAAGAEAQTININTRPPFLDSFAPSGRPFTISMNLTLPAPEAKSTGRIGDGLADAVQMLYELANRQCDVIKAMTKRDCHLETFNINSSINNNGRMGQNSVNASVNATYQITDLLPAPDAAKSDAPKPDAPK